MVADDQRTKDILRAKQQEVKIARDKLKAEQKRLEDKKRKVQAIKTKLPQRRFGAGVDVRKQQQQLLKLRQQKKQ